MEINYANFLSSFLLGLLSFGLTMLLSIASYKYYEIRFLRFKEENYGSGKCRASTQLASQLETVELNIDRSNRVFK
jgi:hypothetical protein